MSPLADFCPPLPPPMPIGLEKTQKFQIYGKHNNSNFYQNDINETELSHDISFTCAPSKPCKDYPFTNTTIQIDISDEMQISKSICDFLACENAQIEQEENCLEVELFLDGCVVEFEIRKFLCGENENFVKFEFAKMCGDGLCFGRIYREMMRYGICFFWIFKFFCV